jgi:hypothetical protein
VGAGGDHIRSGDSSLGSAPGVFVDCVSSPSRPFKGFHPKPSIYCTEIIPRSRSRGGWPVRERGGGQVGK